MLVIGLRLDAFRYAQPVILVLHEHRGVTDFDLELVERAWRRTREHGTSLHIELAAVVVWKVRDTAQATFEVDNYLEFVATQTETAVRHIAIEYPYDAHDEGGLSLRGNAEEITEKLAAELEDNG